MVRSQSSREIFLSDQTVNIGLEALMTAKTKQSQNAHRLFLVTVAAQKARQEHANRFAVGRSQFAGYAYNSILGADSYRYEKSPYLRGCMPA